MKKWLIDEYRTDKTGVTFDTENKMLKTVFDECEELCKSNVRVFGDYKCLIEGAKYIGVWLETQPMGGEMYAKRDLKIALANVLIFLRNQRADGKLPGMIRNDNPWHGTSVHYDWMQGCFLPHSALKLYYLIGKDRDYLELLYDALSKFDEYLWTYRDSNKNGCLECWCIWDTGEDNSTVFEFNGLKMPDHGPWGASVPPENYNNLPFDSPQYMGYSYACRDVLAKISELLENGNAQFWKKGAQKVAELAYEKLWDKERHAFFNYDRFGRKVDALTQENIKCMYSGLMTQSMAEEFLREHLLNENEFFTAMPLPSIAVNDRYFRTSGDFDPAFADDIADNSWGGPVNGLIWQRSIDALLNYGFHKETVIFGKRFLDVLGREGRYVQCYDPFTGNASKGESGYGPTMLAALEYISILCGVNIRYDRILWSAVKDLGKFEYTQTLGVDYTLRCDGETMQAYINGELIFTHTADVRIETDMQGHVLNVYRLN